MQATIVVSGNLDGIPVEGQGLWNTKGKNLNGPLIELSRSIPIPILINPWWWPKAGSTTPNPMTVSLERPEALLEVTTKITFKGRSHKHVVQLVSKVTRAGKAKNKYLHEVALSGTTGGLAISSVRPDFKQSIFPHHRDGESRYERIAQSDIGEIVVFVYEEFRFTGAGAWASFIITSRRTRTGQLMVTARDFVEEKKAEHRRQIR
jgi:hypothetical protein